MTTDHHQVSEATSGIYVVQLRNVHFMPVTRDPRYTETCARVNRSNIKIGKTRDFATRRSNYYKDFDEENVIFEPLAQLRDIATAERAILRALGKQRILSPNGGKLERLQNISCEDAKRIVFATLDDHGIVYTTLSLGVGPIGAPGT